jgi:cyclohexyl-isocyanide hydratase
VKVAILVFPGVEELDFVGFLEVLAVANRVNGREYFETELVGTERGPVRCRGGLRIVPDIVLPNQLNHDLLFVPGGGARSETGVDLLVDNADVLELLKRFHAAGKRVWSVCTGALVLGAAGLLRGRKATTHHLYYDSIRSAGAEVVPERVVREGRLTTGGGVSSSIDVGLVLVEDELGKDVRREVQARIEYPPPKQ